MPKKILLPESPIDHTFFMPQKYFFKSKEGLDEATIKEISGFKNEPVWMKKKRLGAYHTYHATDFPNWGGNLTDLDLSSIHYYLKPTGTPPANSWNSLPEEIKKTYDLLGIPEAEKKYLGGVSAQYESEVVYRSIKKTLDRKGVIFLDMEGGMRECPDLVREYFGSVVPPSDNKFAALNSAVWSGGSFIYVPKGVKVDLPLQAYFRINAPRMGQFERTLIIADEGSFVHYVEGCTAPIYSTYSLHSGVVEIIVKKGARVRYTTVQNWSKNVFNLVTKRMLIEEEGIGEWVDGNIGSKLTMKYPALILKGRGARGEILSIAYAGSGQHQDSGGKALHLASDTSSRIISKSISTDGGRTSYRGLVRIDKKAENAKVKAVCDALILDKESRADTYPLMDVNNPSARVEHEASVSKISVEQLFYLMTRGLSKSEAEGIIVNGFIEPIVKELPLEYAVELNRLINLKMEGSVG